jgi:acetyl-CoA C-acetyltransferase
MSAAFICDAIRTPIGRLNGSLSSIRADDLAAIPLRALMARNPGVDWRAVDDVLMGCANQAGEDNRNVARMAVLLSGLPQDVPASTVNRLCGSGMNAVGMAAQAIRSGDADLLIAGGVESMTRAPYVMGKAGSAFGRDQKIEDTTMGWRFINPALKASYGVDTMPQTAENVAEQWGISPRGAGCLCAGQPAESRAAQASGRFVAEIVPVASRRRKATLNFAADEHPRATTPEALAKLKPVCGRWHDHSGQCQRPERWRGGDDRGQRGGDQGAGLTPRARIWAWPAQALPRVMGIGPVDAAHRVFARTGLRRRWM